MFIWKCALNAEHYSEAQFPSQLRAPPPTAQSKQLFPWMVNQNPPSAPDETIGVPGKFADVRGMEGQKMHSEGAKVPREKAEAGIFIQVICT